MTGTAIQLIAYLGRFASDNKKRFNLTEHKEIRGLNANAYYWVLCEKIAIKSGVKKAVVHNNNLRALQLCVWVGGRPALVALPDTDEAEKWALENDEYHYAPTKQKEVVLGQTKRWYCVLRGSKTFNTEEFSCLIDLAIQDAEALGIETITPAEKQKMMEIYGKSYERKHHTTT